MELTQLEQFKTIATSQTMTSAAEALHISQPALSASLKKLENELGLRLFERHKNKIILNDAGQIVLNHANDILNAVTKMKAELQEYSLKDTIVNIGFDDPGPMWYIMPNISMAYGSDAVKNELYFKQEPLSLLLNEKYDIIVSSKPIIHPNIICQHLIEESIYLSAPANAPLANLTAIDLKKTYPSSIIHYTCKGQHETDLSSFWQEVAKLTNMKVYTDYFIFNQIIRNENVYTLTTKLVKHYRDDGPNRILIPVINEETITNYYISYVKNNETKVLDYINFITYIIKCID